MVKLVAWIELLTAAVLLAGAALPFSGFCTGRFMGLDCESRAILGVLLFAPLGAILLVCGAWFLRTGSPKSQYALVLGVTALAAYTLVQLL